MAVLSDGSIRRAVECGELVVDPFEPTNVQPSSLDLTIGEKLVLVPGKFRLVATHERIKLSARIQGQVHGRSSIGRLGVLVHFTAGLIDPGFDGTITLECMALDKQQEFRVGDRIAQVSFLWLDTSAERPYRGRYQWQVRAEPSRFRHADEELEW
jgi:dCTP deaminase